MTDRYIYHPFNDPTHPYSIYDRVKRRRIQVDDLAYCCGDWFTTIVSWLNQDHLGEQEYIGLALGDLGGTKRGFRAHKDDRPHFIKYELRAGLVINLSLRTGYDFDSRLRHKDDRCVAGIQLRAKPLERLTKLVAWLNAQYALYNHAYSYADKVNAGRYEI